MIDRTTIEDIVVKIDEVVKFVINSQKEENNLRAEQKRCEDRQQDILHEFEFSQLSRRERNLLAKELKEIRLERRYVKGLIELIEPFSQQVKSKSGAASTFSSIANRVREIRAQQEARTYGPREGDSDLKIDNSQHYEVSPTDKSHKFKVAKRK